VSTEKTTSEFQVGDVVLKKDFSLTRESLVRYAGASGDLNPIHYRDDIAKAVGLEGVLAHGMLTMGLAVSPVSSWLGDLTGGRGHVLSYQVRFTKPVYVPAEGAASVSVTGTVAKIDDPAPGQLTLALAVTNEAGASVLGKAFVVVSLS
jgi:acyl dehydratase